MVGRPRLFEALDRGVAGPVTLVTGPAGAGKTVLVRSWLGERERAPRVGWVTAEPAGHDGLRFWSAAWAALDATDGASSPAVAPNGGSKELVQRLIDGVDPGDRPILVLDDVHQLRAQDALDGLDSMLARLPVELRLILIGRQAPAVDLHALRQRGALTNIGEADLRFTPAEADELIAGAGVSLSAANRKRLVDRTEGWAAGLSLAGAWLAGRPDADRAARDFSGSEGPVADYLIEEVLSAQPPKVRHLLLRTCLLDRVNGALVERLAGRSDGERLLRGLEDEHALVSSVDANRTWFRYHALLSDLLRAQLRRDAPEDVEGLHLQAAHWYTDHGMAEDAIRHAEDGQDWRYAGELLADAWFGLFLDGRQSTTSALLGELPPELVSADGELMTLLAADRLVSGSYADADLFLALAERLANTVVAGRRRRFEVVLAVVKLTRSRSRGALEATLEAAHSVLAAQWTPRAAGGFAEDDLRAVALMNLGFVELWSMRLEDADRHLAEAVELAARIERPYIGVACLGTWAEVAAMSHDLDLAEGRSREAIELADRLGWSNDPVVGPACSALAGVLFTRGQLEEGEQWLRRAEQALDGLPDLESSVVLRVRRGWLLYLRGQNEQALACFRAAQRARERLGAPHFLSRLTETWQSRVLIRLGDFEQARSALAEAGGAAGAQPELCLLAASLYLEEGNPETAVAAVAPILDGSTPVIHDAFRMSALFLEAVARERLDQRDATRQALERALDLAEPDGHVWPVLTIPDVAPLLERYAPHAKRHRSFVAESLERFAATTTPSVPGQELSQPLTDRELTVLPYLATNLVAREIASELNLSVHTVKTHMRNVYAKLDVHRRSDAVSRARAAGLLPP